MAVSLEQIREKFPNANYAPREGCKYCDGTGVKKNVPKVELLKVPDEGLPCICVFVDHEMCDFAAKSLADTARKIKNEMQGG